MIEKIPLDGGHPCLDFVNTVSARYPEKGAEYLNSLNDLMLWLRRVDFLAEEELRPAERELLHAEEEFLEQALAIREAMYSVFRDLAETNDVSAEALSTFNACLRQAYQQVQLEKTETGLRRGFRGSSRPTLPLSSSPYIPLWRLLLLAEELLLQTDLWTRIRACPACGWLFLDTSKGGRRRWCNMQACGSQVKALRWYHKHKKE